LKAHVGPDGICGEYATLKSSGNVKCVIVNQYKPSAELLREILKAFTLEMVRHLQDENL
jgi:hypothetical protein